MRLNRTDAFWDRDTRNSINENWETIEGMSDNISDEITNNIDDYITNAVNDILGDKNLDGTVKNNITNGNFTSTFAWRGLSGASISASDNVLTATGNGNHTMLRVTQNEESADLPNYKTNDKWYFSGKFKVDSDNTNMIAFALTGTTKTGTIQYITKTSPDKNKEHHLTGIVTLPSDGSGKLLTQIRATYPSENDANGVKFEARELLSINLTETFGKGNEPSLAFMDGLLNSIGGYFENRLPIGDSVNVALKSSLENKSKIEKLESDNQIDITNHIENGDFRSGTDKWSALSGSNITHGDKALNVNGNGNTFMVRAYQYSGIPYKLGSKVYVRAEFEINNDNCNRAGFYIRSSSAPASNETFIMQTSPNKNKKFIMSGVVDITDAKGSGFVGVYARADYEDGATANGTVMKVRNVIALNLTEDFGKGNEPDRESLDNLISAYPDSFFDNKPDSSDMQKALISSMLKKNESSKKPLIALTIDDGNTTDYTTAWPLYKERGLKGTSWLIGKRMNTNDARWLNTDMIQEMYADGWDFQCHTYNHEHFTEYATDEEIRAEFTLNDDLFPSLGLPKPKHHAYPFGDYDRNVINIGLKYRESLRATGKTSGMDYNEWDRPNYGSLNAKSIDIRDVDVERIDEIKKIIDDTIEHDEALILYHHQLLDNPAEYEAKTEHVITILDYIKSKVDDGLIESVTISDMVNRFKNY